MTLTPTPLDERARRRAFTLIELVVVIVIMGVLVGIGAFAYNAVIESGRKDAASKTAEQYARSVQGLSATKQVAAAALRTDHLADLEAAVSDAAAVNAAVTWQEGPAANGAIRAEVTVNGYCVPVEFLGTAGVRGLVGEAVKATSCMTQSIPGSTTVPLDPDALVVLNQPAVIGVSSSHRIELLQYTGTALTVRATVLDCPNGCAAFPNAMYFRDYSVSPSSTVTCRQPNGTTVDRTTLRSTAASDSVALGATSSGGVMSRTVELTPCQAGERIMAVRYGRHVNTTNPIVEWSRPS